MKYQKVLCFHEIIGFCYPVDVFFMAKLLNSFTRPFFCEFGVYYGRSIINILLNCDKPYRSIAIDPFPDFDLVKKDFISNIKTFQVSIELYSTRDLVLETNFSLVHIDSFHTEIDLIEDISFALKGLRDDGVLVIDDVWSDIFPGVTSATFKIIHERNLSVFLVTTAKIYVCKEEYHSLYNKKIKKLLDKENIKYFTEFAGQSNSIRNFEVLSLKELSEDRVINHELDVDSLFKYFNANDLKS
jgi:hypothetical protein